MLTESLTQVELSDIQYAIKSGFISCNDIEWISLNIVSILSNKDSKRVENFKADYYKITGKSYSCPNNEWSGYWKNVVELVHKLTNLSKDTINKRMCKFGNSDKLVNLRMRKFGNNLTVFAPSKELPHDYYDNYYLWSYIGGKLRPVPEQLIKEQLLEYEDEYEMVLFE